MSEVLNSLRIAPDLVLLGDGAQYDFLSWLIPRENWEDWHKQSVQIRYAAYFSKERTPGGWLISTPKLLPHMNVYIPAEGEEWGGLHKTGTRFAVFEMFPFGKAETGTLLQDLEEANNSPEALLVLVKLPLHSGATDLIPESDDRSKVLAENRAQGRAVMVIQERREDILRVLHWHEPLGDYTIRELTRAAKELRTRQAELKWDYDFCLADWEDENGFLGPQNINLSKISEFKAVRNSRASSIWDCYAERTKKLLFPSNRRGGLLGVVGIYTDCFEGDFWNSLPFLTNGDILVRRMEATLDRRLDESRIEVSKPRPFTEENYRKVVEQYHLIEKFETCILHFIREDLLKLAQDLLGERCGQLEQICAEYVQKRC